MRRPVVLTAAVLATVAGLVPAHAATKPKPKPKPLHGSYTVTLVPDPSTEVIDSVPGKKGCSGVSPAGKDTHPLTIPAKGTLHVVLDSPDPTGAQSVGSLGQVGTDWDLYVLDAGGSIDASSNTPTSHEVITDKFTHAQPVSLLVCNLIGEPTGTVTWTFTYA